MANWRPTKDSSELLRHCQRVLGEYDSSITLRQLYYILASEGHVSLDEASYRKVKNLMINARKASKVPPTTFSKPYKALDESVYSTAASYLEDCVGSYRIPRTYNQPNHVEIWVEREPHKVFVESVVSEYDVPVFTTGGYSSFSFVFDAAKRIESSAERRGSPRILYLSDFSPSSVNMFESQVSEISSHLSMSREEVEAIMLRVCVEPEHIIRYDLPIIESARPTQKTALFEATYSDLLETLGLPKVPFVEIESLNPKDLEEIINNVLFSLTDQEVLTKVPILESDNRKKLEELRQL